MAQSTEGKGLRLMGHPVHAMLSDFPLALLLTSLVADGVALFTSETFWWAVSFWIIAAGVVVAVPVAFAGLVDFATIAVRRGAGKTATVHLVVMLTAVGCFGVDLVLRGGTSVPHGSILVAAMFLDVLGAALLAVGAWYGGELVFGHRIGVSQSPSSGSAPPR